MSALAKWRYKPATLNGQPVEHSMTRTIIRFQIEDRASGASREFVRSFKEIQSALAAKDLTTAQTLLTDLRYRERRSLYEDAWFWWLYSTYLEFAKGDIEEQHDALTKAIGYEEIYLAPDMFVSAAARLFVLRVQRNDLSGALEIYKRLTSTKQVQRVKTYSEIVPKLEPTVQQIERAVASDNVLMVRGRVGPHDYWVHPLVRRTFSVGKIEGPLEHVSIRCSRRNVIFTPVTDEHTWTVPASYGDCSVYLKGMPGATFDFYEYPATAAAAAPTP
jgi:hypothetical protein